MICFEGKFLLVSSFFCFPFVYFGLFVGVGGMFYLLFFVCFTFWFVFVFDFCFFLFCFVFAFGVFGVFLGGGVVYKCMFDQCSAVYEVCVSIFQHRKTLQKHFCCFVLFFLTL